MSSEMIDTLARAVQKAQNNSFFLGNIFSEFQQQNDLDDKTLATLIGCDIQNLSRLALCRCPVADQNTFASDVDRLAHRFSLYGNELANIIRQVEALRAFREQLMNSNVAHGLLLAARDRENSATPADGDDE